MNGYQIIKAILGIIWVCSIFSALIFLIKWIVMFLSGNPDKDKRKKTAVIVLVSMLVSVIFLVTNFAVSVKQYAKTFDYENAPRFEVTSDSLHNGVWNREIGAKNGNISPSLIWDEVKGAGCYAVVMLDKDADNWLHLKVMTEKAGVLAGEFVNKQDGYVGPYPPSGTHHYTVYVFALKGSCRNLTAQLDMGGLDFDEFLTQLNDGETTAGDNIVAVGTVTGEYSAER